MNGWKNILFNCRILSNCLGSVLEKKTTIPLSAISFKGSGHYGAQFIFYAIFDILTSVFVLIPSIQTNSLSMSLDDSSDSLAFNGILSVLNSQAPFPSNYLYQNISWFFLKVIISLYIVTILFKNYFFLSYFLYIVMTILILACF